MGDPDAESHSFIVKVWLEETAAEAGQPTWRGSVTHVPGGERRYFEDLRVLIAFVTTYLQQMGVHT